MANKTISPVYLNFSPADLINLQNLNQGLVRLWNMLKIVIDERLSKASRLKEKNKLLKKVCAYLNVLIQKSSGLVSLGARIGILEKEKQISENEAILKTLGISSISLNYLLTADGEIVKKLKEEGFNIPSDLIRQLAAKISASYSSFFALKKNNDSRARIPGYKDAEKGIAPICWSSFKFEDGVLILSLPEKVKLNITLPAGIITRIGTAKPCYVQLLKLPQPNETRWKLDVVVSYEAPASKDKPQSIRAIDLGAGNIAVSDSSGAEYLIPTRRGEKFWMDRIAQVERRMKNRTKGSRGYISLSEARRKMHLRIRYQHNDHQRKLAHALCKDVDCVVVGKPRTRLGMSRSKKLSPEQHHGVQNTGYMSRMMIYIKEKCTERGIIYIELPDPPRIGHINDPEVKFEASRKLLVQVLQNTGLSEPSVWTRSKLKFNQGGKRKKKVKVK
jgi:hypothetical protein